NVCPGTFCFDVYHICAGDRRRYVRGEYRKHMDDGGGGGNRNSTSSVQPGCSENSPVPYWLPAVLRTDDHAAPRCFYVRGNIYRCSCSRICVHLERTDHIQCEQVFGNEE